MQSLYRVIKKSSVVKQGEEKIKTNYKKPVSLEKEIEKEIKETQETIRYARDEMSSVLDELEDSVQEPGLNE